MKQFSAEQILTPILDLSMKPLKAAFSSETSLAVIKAFRERERESERERERVREGVHIACV
jgi:hypothetical protein